jgi:hypothetical protein
MNKKTNTNTISITVQSSHSIGAFFTLFFFSKFQLPNNLLGPHKIIALIKISYSDSQDLAR